MCDTILKMQCSKYVSQTPLATNNFVFLGAHKTRLIKNWLSGNTFSLLPGPAQLLCWRVLERIYEGRATLEPQPLYIPNCIQFCSASNSSATRQRQGEEKNSRRRTRRRRGLPGSGSPRTTSWSDLDTDSLTWMAASPFPRCRS